MARQHPTPLRKLQQLWRLVRESHANPIAGAPRLPEICQPGELGVTFIGHSSFLIQVGGKNLLIDPVFSRRLILLRRQRHAGLRIQDLPPIHAVLITHAHMDHLNLPSLRRIIRHTRRLTGQAPEAIVPRNVSDLVNKLGFRKITELEWWQSTELQAAENRPISRAPGFSSVKHGFSHADTAPPEQGASAPGPSHQNPQPVKITMTPCKHWGARMFNDMHRHYGGYVISTGAHTVYHSGDTAYFPGFREIGRLLKPEVALLPIGAYFPDSYRSVHTSPEEALRAFQDLATAHTMVPMHYGTFPLGREPMDEPLQRLQAAARKARLHDRIQVLAEGETLRLPPAKPHQLPRPETELTTR